MTTSVAASCSPTNRSIRTVAPLTAPPPGPITTPRIDELPPVSSTGRGAASPGRPRRTTPRLSVGVATRMLSTTVTSPNSSLALGRGIEGLDGDGLGVRIPLERIEDVIPLRERGKGLLRTRTATSRWRSANLILRRQTHQGETTRAGYPIAPGLPVCSRSAVIIGRFDHPQCSTDRSCSGFSLIGALRIVGGRVPRRSQHSAESSPNLRMRQRRQRSRLASDCEIRPAPVGRARLRRWEPS